MNPPPRTEADLLQLIRDKVEESVVLDYKRGEALTKAKGDLTKEVTKDVSAFANSAGGVLIYGISEGSDATKHQPVALAPIDRNEFSKERLEHLINNIQPRIAGVEIVSVSLSSGANDAAYVVSIPASTTAHQCTDKRYYRRFNFEAVAMEDYEVRDVMSRRTLPKIELVAEITFSLRKLVSSLPDMPMVGREKPNAYPFNTISFAATNEGGVRAQHVVAYVTFPPKFLKDYEDGGRLGLRNFLKQETGEYAMGYAKRGNPQWVPILPSLSLDLDYYELPMTIVPENIPDFAIPWSVHCDDAPGREGVFTPANVAVTVEGDYKKWLQELRESRQ